MEAKSSGESSFKSLPHIDLTQLEDVSKDIAIPNVLASLPPALARMVTSSAGCKIQAFRSPQLAVLPASQDPTLVPGCKGTHLFRVICPGGDPVDKQTLVELPVGTENQTPYVPSTAYVTGRVKPKTVLKRIDEKTKNVNKKIQKVQAVRERLRKRYARLKGYIKHLNELRRVKGLPVIMLQEDLKETRVVKAADKNGTIDNADKSFGLDVAEGGANSIEIAQGADDSDMDVND